MRLGFLDFKTNMMHHNIPISML